MKEKESINELGRQARDKYLAWCALMRLREAVKTNALWDLLGNRKTWIRIWAVVDFATVTGCRVSEIADVKVGDFGLTAATPGVWIKRKRRRQQHNQYVALPKGTVSHLREFLAWKKANGEGVSPGDYIFTNERRSRHDTRSLRALFKKALRGAGLSPHFWDQRQRCRNFVL